jgi:hypothetical protein
MATYAELITASTDTGLRDKIRVACVVAAETVRTELASVPNHTERLKWAQKVFLDPSVEALRMTWAVLAQNRAATLAAITGASDAAVQTAVDAAVNVFAVNP